MLIWLREEQLRIYLKTKTIYLRWGMLASKFLTRLYTSSPLCFWSCTVMCTLFRLYSEVSTILTEGIFLFLFIFISFTHFFCFRFWINCCNSVCCWSLLRISCFEFSGYFWWIITVSKSDEVRFRSFA